MSSSLLFGRGTGRRAAESQWDISNKLEMLMSLTSSGICWCSRTNAVPHPGTVVVELGDAAVAHGTVFGPDGLPYL